VNEWQVVMWENLSQQTLLKKALQNLPEQRPAMGQGTGPLWVPKVVP